MTTTPQRFTKRPVTIEAIQYDEHDPTPAIEWIRDNDGSAWLETRIATASRPAVIAIETLEGTMNAQPGDWIIRGVQGEFYPCKPDIFEATYKPAQGGFIAPHVSEETRAAIQEQLRDCILPQSWADTVTAEHDAHHNRIRDTLDATTYPDRPDPATYPYWTGDDGEAAEHVEGEQNAPTDAEVEAAAEAVCEWDCQYTYGSLEDDSPAKSMYQVAARAALVAAREVSGR